MLSMSKLILQMDVEKILLSKSHDLDSLVSIFCTALRSQITSNYSELGSDYEVILEYNSEIKLNSTDAQPYY